MNQIVRQTVRARDLGIPFAGRCGPMNAITDVPGVTVGHTTIVRDDKPNDRDLIAVRTGVTAILPRSRDRILNETWAGLSSFNGNGEMTGAHWIDEAGHFFGPILLTNTHSVGCAHQSCLKWLFESAQYNEENYPWLLPVVAETCDAYLNDMNGFHVKEDHVFQALDTARDGPVEEGNVGGGTGMRCYEYKGGVGTASRIVDIAGGEHVLGAIVQANFGLREDLRILGMPVNQETTNLGAAKRDSGSIIVVIATSAPLLPIQLQRIARRCAIGMGRTGTPAYNGSGDIFLAFTTNETQAVEIAGSRLNCLDTAMIDPLFRGCVDAVEEAIVNSLVAAKAMTGHRGRSVDAIDHNMIASLFSRAKYAT